MRSLARLHPSAFTRERILTLPVLLAAMISGFKAGVQNELNAFFAQLVNQADLLRVVSAQAFSKARKNFSHEAFDRLNQHLLALVRTHLSQTRWRGWRLVAGDGSKVRLFLADATGRRAVRDAAVFGLYLPGQELTLAARLYPELVGERQMLCEHLDRLDRRDLLLLDRGYPAGWLLALLAQRQIAFCLRVDATGFAAVRTFLRSGQAETTVSIAAPKPTDAADYGCACTPTQVRLVRVVTPNGKVHVVMTSLLDARAYPAATFAGLYHQRWRIEEAFKRLKLRLALENTSGLSWLAAQQDLGAKILADNLHALTSKAAMVDKGGDGDDGDDGGEAHLLVSHYKVNRTYALAHLKRCLPRWLLGALPDAASLAAALAELARVLVRFIPGATKPRPEHPKPHRKHAYKSTT